MLTDPVAPVVERRQRRAEARAVFRAALAKAAVAALVVLVAFTFVFGVARIQGNGMKPTAGDGDLALTYRLDEGFSPDDVVAYRTSTGKLVGRIVAKPGDTVEVTATGELKVNGSIQPSTTGELTKPAANGPAYPITLAEGEYFILGDDRAEAVDSREAGAISDNQIEGKIIALLRIRDF